MSFFAFVAAAISAPSFAPDDMRYLLRSLPPSVSREKKWTAVQMRFFTDPQGTVLKCLVREYLGHQDVAEEMCRRQVGRRIRSARNAEGKRAYGFLDQTVVFVGSDDSDLGDRFKPWPDGDWGNVDFLPASTMPELPHFVPLLLEIDVGGQLTHCESARSDKPASSVAAACKTLEGRKFETISAGEQGAVPYVREFLVIFPKKGE